MQLNNVNIDPEAYYSASAIIKNGFFPWIKSAMTFTGMLKTQEGLDLYKPIVRIAGTYTRYKIKGSNVIEIRDMASKGELKI